MVGLVGPPRFATGSIRFFLLLRFQTHADFCLGLHSRPNGCCSSFLSESRISRVNTFPRFRGEYIVSHVSFSEIAAT